MSSRRKRVLPQGRSWPIRPAQLLDALGDLGAPAPSTVLCSTVFRNDDVVLDVSWHPIPQGTGLFGEPWAAGDENVAVFIRDVPSTERIAIEQAVRENLVPQLASWLTSAATAPEGWRVIRHEREWSWDHGAIVLTKEHDGKIKNLRRP